VGLAGGAGSGSAALGTAGVRELGTERHAVRLESGLTLNEILFHPSSVPWNASIRARASVLSGRG